MATDGAASSGDEIKQSLTATGVIAKATARSAPGAFLGTTVQVRKGGSVL
jgi:hypothetical protein